MRLIKFSSIAVTVFSLHYSSAEAASCSPSALSVMSAFSAELVDKTKIAKSLTETASKCPKGVRRRVASTDMSNYGNGDGFEGRQTSCGPLMSTKQLQVALRCDIFKNLQVRGGKKVGKPAICGKQIAITWKGQTVMGKVVDCGGLRPGRELDVSPAVKRAFQPDMPLGISKVSYDLCE